jgi:hypothetical protein
MGERGLRAANSKREILRKRLYRPHVYACLQCADWKLAFAGRAEGVHRAASSSVGSENQNDLTTELISKSAVR